jgi:hypothetical protein
MMDMGVQSNQALNDMQQHRPALTIAILKAQSEWLIHKIALQWLDIRFRGDCCLFVGSTESSYWSFSRDVGLSVIIYKTYHCVKQIFIYSFANHTRRFPTSNQLHMH